MKTTILAAAALLSGCCLNPVKPAPSLEMPEFDARLTQPCPDTYSILAPDANWAAVQDAHKADIAQAEACRIKHDALIKEINDARAAIKAKNPQTTQK